jgi:hypothetical protein
MMYPLDWYLGIDLQVNDQEEMESDEMVLVSFKK